MRLLDDQVSLLRANALAPSTRRTYHTYLDTYLKFCCDHSIKPIPISYINLGRYIAFLSMRLQFSSIRNYLSVVRLLHLEVGLTNPVDNFHISRVLKGARRLLGDSSCQKLPITPIILMQILPQLDIKSPRDICFWAACLVAFFSFFRKSNLFPPSLKDFNPNIHLSRHNVSFSPNGVILHVHWSKTIQFRERSLSVPLPLILSSPLCPTQALLLLFRLCPSKNLKIPVFMFPTPGGCRLLSYDIFLSRLRECLGHLRIDHSKYSGHSFRRGGASFALECGLPHEIIQAQGDWRSDAYKKYIDTSLAYRQHLSTSLGEAIKKKF